jgi:hypothetical protein
VICLHSTGLLPVWGNGRRTNDGTIGHETTPIISFTKSRWNADEGRCLEDDEDEKRDKKSGTHQITVRRKLRTA